MEGIADAALQEAADRADKGQIDADLGGDVIKQRIARRGLGRSICVKGETALRALKRGDFIEVKEDE
jgi:hypothetical protein